MFQKVFEYAGPHKKGLYAATAVVLVSVLMGVLPFVLAYQVIAPLVMGAELDASFLILRVVLVLVCLVLQAVLYGWGLNLSHKAAYDTLLRLRKPDFLKISSMGNPSRYILTTRLLRSARHIALSLMLSICFLIRLL